MEKQYKRSTLPSGTLRHGLASQGGALSLLPLKLALTAAERESLAQPPRPPLDPNEPLAMQLIEKIKQVHSILPADLTIEPPRPIFAAIQEMAGSDAQ